MNYLFVTPSRGGKMLQDSEGFKFYSKNGLYVCQCQEVINVTFYVVLGLQPILAAALGPEIVLT